MNELTHGPPGRRMISHPKLSVIIPWCDRNELRETLARNHRYFEEYSAEVLVVCCGGDLQRLKYLVADSKLEMLRLIHIRRSTFNKSISLNLGVHLSRSSLLFVLDTDIVLQGDIFESALSTVGKVTFVTVENVCESSQTKAQDLKEPGPTNWISSVVTAHLLEITFLDGRSITITTNRRNDLDGCRAGPGLVFVGREEFIAINGYSSDLQGWGWEDDDFQLRLKYVLGMRQVETGNAIHLSHGDDQRALFGQSRQQSNARNFSICYARYGDRNFQGTFTSDVSTWELKTSEITGFARWA
jgi:predicted glycosyltransferase involved in capsule biosynthesis